MTHKKRGHLIVSGEWAKHLRNKKKKLFWKGERCAGKILVRTELKSHTRHRDINSDQVTNQSSKNQCIFMGRTLAKLERLLKCQLRIVKN